MAAVSTATALTAVPASARTGGAPSVDASVPATDTAYTVTLITGDVVRLVRLPDGRQSATLTTPGRHGQYVAERDGHVQVVPAEALPYVASGALDEDLFDITGLVEQGYHDRARKTLPVLMTVAGDEPARFATPPGITGRRDLGSIKAAAVRVDKSRARDFWESIDDDRPDDGVTRLATGVRQLTLDKQVRATLAESVPQIGAPGAWASGYTGKGVKVAVLDTGYDPTHPDLTGRVHAAADFTGEGTPVDKHGHGTHVAATVGGTGAGAGGTRKGVAPDAQLLIGKVLNEYGGGETSWIIAGMEWAVQQGARVVNMSLGGEPTDGSDPLSQAVDNLTASSGALFVVSAGNSGPGEHTVGAPGAADAALTVGAVSKQDELAEFSSRGPRRPDGALKPEITAPGVGIIAARATGTQLGQLVDARYTALSGTSMAAPHVAGAAAILAQRHPDWTATQLKSALVASADPIDGARVTEQGSGRVDLTATLAQTVLPGTGSVQFGQLPASAAEPLTREVTYTNTGDQPVVLDLDVDVRRVDGRRAPMLAKPSRLTVAPGATGTATLHLNPRTVEPGEYGGVLVARRAGQGQLRVPVGFAVQAPTVTLTVSALDRLGNVPGSYSQVQAWNLDSGEQHLAFFGPDATLDLPAGRYAVAAFILTQQDGWDRNVTFAAHPELKLTADRTLRYDARKAREIRVDTPQRAVPTSLTVAWQRSMPGRTHTAGFSFNAAILNQVYALPSPAATTGSFELQTRFDLREPVLRAAVAGPGRFELPPPVQIAGSAPLSGRLSLPLVDAGAGTPAELAAAAVRDRIALIRWAGREATATQVRDAAAAGARMVLLHNPEPGWWDDTIDEGAIPAYAIEQPTGRRLLDRLARGPVVLDLVGTPQTPYRYDLLLAETRRVPAGHVHDTRTVPLATIRSDFHAHAPGWEVQDSRAGFRPDSKIAFSFARVLPAGTSRTDYVNADGVLWRHEAVANVEFRLFPMGEMHGLTRRYRAGEQTREVWFPAVTRPAIPATDPDLPGGAPVNRAYDTIRVAVPEYANGAGDQYGWTDFYTGSSTLTLRSNGKTVGQVPGSRGQFVVGGDAADYELNLSVSRDRNDSDRWWTTSTATDTTWSFRSARPAGDDPQLLPLLQLGYELNTDLDNQVSRERPYQLVLRPGYQPGASGSGGFSVQVQLSYDDGKTWSDVPVRAAGTGDVAAEFPAAGPDRRFVSVRVTAQDGAGNRIDQKIMRAWRLG